MQPSGNGSTQENPVVKWFKDWAARTPYVSRTTIIFLAFLQIGEFIMNVNVAQKIANIPQYTIFEFEVYRLILSPFALGGLLDFLFTCLVFSSFGPRLESAMGSASLLSMMGILSLTTNIIFDAFAIVMAMNPINPFPSAVYLPCFGFWLIVYGLLVHDCLQTPGTQRRLWLLPINVPSEYYPWGLLALFSLLFGIQISSFIAVGTGYLYAYGYLGFAIPSSQRIQSWEQGWLSGIVTTSGYIDCSASQGFHVLLPTSQLNNSNEGGSNSNWGTVIRQGERNGSQAPTHRNVTSERTLGSSAQSSVPAPTNKQALREAAAAAAEARIPPAAANIAGQSLKGKSDVSKSKNDVV